MRILLVQTRTMFDEPPIFPLGLAYLWKPLLDQGHTVFAHDSNLGIGDSRSLGRRIHTVQPEIVGLSIRNIKNARPGVHQSAIHEHRQIAQIIKSQAPNAILVAGGAGFSLYGFELMKAIPEIDLGIFGEGEESFPELLEDIDNPQKVMGVFWRDGETVHFTGRRDALDFSSLHRPNRRPFEVASYGQQPMGIGIQAKRGCALDCIHCSNHYLFQRRLRIREPGDIVDEIEEMVHNFGLRQFMFADEIFNLPRHHADSICEGILTRGLRLSWSAWFKESEITEDSARLYGRAGCHTLMFSPDVAADTLFDLWGKGLTEADLYHSLDVVHKSGLCAEWNFMVNGPGETWSSLWKIMKFLATASTRLRGRLRPSSYYLVAARIYPHTRLQKLSIDHDLIKPNDDLTDPMHYNPAPKSYLLNPIMAGLGAAWRFRQFARAINDPGVFRD